jgi:hypothetical protein
MNKKALIIKLLLISGLLIASPLIYLDYLRVLEQDDDQKSINIPQGIRLTIIDDLDSSIAISWYTEKHASDPRVAYATNLEFQGSYSIRANFVFISPYYIYHANLNGLEANKTYFYRVYSDSQNRRDVMNFTTLATKSNITRVLAFGDSRTLRAERRMVSQGISREFLDKFDFFFHTGDIVEDGRDQGRWNQYFEDTEGMNRYKQGIFVEGNHERGESLTAKMYDNLLMNTTSTNRYYAFSYNEIGFIILNSNPYAAGEESQTDWLNATLFNYAKKNTYNLIYLHHPLLHEDRTEQYFLDNWRPLFDKYNVSLVFCGHNHHYERSYPISNSSTLEYDDSELYNYSNLTDPIYIVTGGAGAPLYTVKEDPFIAHTKEVYHFVLLEIEKEQSKSTLTLETWEIPEDHSNCKLIDNITITKYS